MWPNFIKSSKSYARSRLSAFRYKLWRGPKFRQLNSSIIYLSCSHCVSVTVLWPLHKKFILSLVFAAPISHFFSRNIKKKTLILYLAQFFFAFCVVTVNTRPNCRTNFSASSVPVDHVNRLQSSRGRWRASNRKLPLWYLFTVFFHGRTKG